MFTAFRHTHILVIVVFLLLFLIKALLLFFNRGRALDGFRKQTRALDSIFGLLILITGAYLLFAYPGPWPAWLWVKAGLVLIGIPLSIIGLRRKNKAVTALCLVLFCYVYGVSESQNLAIRSPYDPDPAEAFQGPDTSASASASPTDEGKTENAAKALPPAPAIDQIERNIVNALEEGALENAQAIYTQQCVSCHGTDGGKLIAPGANLRQSRLSLQDSETVIKEGRGLMPAYAEKLTEQEVVALAAYTRSLAK